MKIDWKNNLFILFTLVFFSSRVLCQEKDLGQKDGVDWLNYTESYKIGYVSGFILGITVADNEYKKSSNSLKLSLVLKKIKEDIKKEFEHELEECHKKIGLYNITVGQIKDGVDDFYKDFSNRRIKTIDSIYVVKIKIIGESPELIDAQIRYLRMQPIDWEIQEKIYVKYSEFFDKKGHFPTYKEIKDGEFSGDDLLKIGLFVDANNNDRSLFCYGDYE